MNNKITKALLMLPPIVYLNMTHHFRLIIINNGTDDLRLCYELFTTTQNWKNPYFDYKSCNFLWIKENIATDVQLIEAVYECAGFLFKNKLVQ